MCVILGMVIAEINTSTENVVLGSLLAGGFSFILFMLGVIVAYVRNINRYSQYTREKLTEYGVRIATLEKNDEELFDLHQSGVNVCKFNPKNSP
jgi:uncharacterized membrane protein (DUF106 family)